MHKHFYASGFLYHSPSQKILLQQTITDTKPSFTLFCRKCTGNNDHKTSFQQIIADELGITIPIESIFHVYDYVTQDTEEIRFVFYADVSGLGTEVDFKREGSTEWFTVKQLSKLKLHRQINHDLMIGQRVIRAKDSV